MELSNRNVLVVGFELTGEAVCRFLLDHGARVLVTEKKNEDAFGKRVERWRKRGVRFETGGHRPRSFLEADLIVPSPGVPPLTEISAARGIGVPVLSEIELASRFLKGSIIAITGSNGKSTTTTLIDRILKDAGLKSFLAGNIGTPLISFVGGSRDDHIYVTEVSSFQLAYVDRFKPHISVFLNISQNHLDWHKTFEAYFETKKKLVLGLEDRDKAVLNRDDPLVWKLAGDTRAEVYGFSRKRSVRTGCSLEDGWIIFRDGKSRRLFPASRIPLPGLHNLENVMAAAVVGRLLGMPASRIQKSVAAFKGLEHRLEEAGEVGGVRFINDSKATTVDATLKALASLDRKVVLILGGRDKGGDFALLRRPLKSRVKSVILVGEAKEKIESALRGTVPMETARSYREVVEKGYAAAARGDVVLLAPACTSWDMFKNFEERGRLFKREVKRLAAKVEGKEA